jgi:hypothetical protein
MGGGPEPRAAVSRQSAVGGRWRRGLHMANGSLGLCFTTAQTLGCCCVTCRRQRNWYLSELPPSQGGQAAHCVSSRSLASCRALRIASPAPSKDMRMH